MPKMTSTESQYVLGLLKARYDECYQDQRSGAMDWKEADAEKATNKRAQEKILGHKVKRAGYQYSDGE